MPKSEHKTKPKHSVHVRLDLDTFETLRDYAAKRKLSVSWVINDTLSRAARIIRSSEQQ